MPTNSNVPMEDASQQSISVMAKTTVETEVTNKVVAVPQVLTYLLFLPKAITIINDVNILC